MSSEHSFQKHQQSSTHADGIQPSASFFRPSRPDQYPRPPSTVSILAPDPDTFQLAPTGSTELLPVPESFNPVPKTPKRGKHSREPLLPIGGSVSTSTSFRTPTTISTVQQASRSTRRVRNSLEIFSGARNSTESSTRPSGSTQVSPSQQTFYHPYGEERPPTLPPSFPSPRLRRSSHISPASTPEPSAFAFIPNPPHGPPLRSLPVIDPITGKPIRNYTKHPSRNKFFFGGRLLTGGDSPWAFIASLALVAIISAVWFGTTCVWWWRTKSPAVAIVGAYFFLLTISLMLATAFRDPGILPRGLDPDPPYPVTSPSDGSIRVPMPRDLKVRADVVRVKYCPTCKTYRPPRSAHCKMCDNCVDGCDHHCQWVNNCVGRRNYTVFFAFLVFAVVTAALVICTSALHIYFLTRRGDTDFRRALRKGAGSAVVFCLAGTVIWPVGVLLSYHMRLLLLNITTIEQIRNNAHKALVPGPPPPNPFSHGSVRKNFFNVLCRPEGFSWLDGPGVVTEDRRMVNPGMGEHADL